MPILRAKVAALASVLVLTGISGAQMPSPSLEQRLDAQAAAEAVLNATPLLNDPNVPSGVAESYVTVEESELDAEGNVYTVEDGTITLPDEADLGVAVDNPSLADENININLPFANDETERHETESGLVVYENDNETFTVPMPYEDGSVQVNTVIESSSAPTRHPYAIDLPEGVVMNQEDGGFITLTRDAETVAIVAPAWARDANGNDVKTWYEIEGSTIVQVVEHSDQDAYPIVADPYLGKNLFGHVYTDWYNKNMRVNASLSAFGWVNYASLSGQRILNTYGLDEVLSRGADVRKAMAKKSMLQQFQCHALGALAAGQWNLEKFRVDRTAHWSYGVAVHHCNWKTATKY